MPKECECLERRRTLYESPIRELEGVAEPKTSSWISIANRTWIGSTASDSKWQRWLEKENMSILWPTFASRTVKGKGKRCSKLLTGVKLLFNQYRPYIYIKGPCARQAGILTSCSMTPRSKLFKITAIDVSKATVRYTPPTPTRLYCRVESQL